MSVDELLAERWEELAAVKEEMAARDWFPGTSGNLSIRVTDDPLTFLVSASGKDKRKRTDEDFVLVNEEGVPVGETHLRPSAETPVHVWIYRLTDARCCLHIHTVDNNVITELYAAQGKVVFHGQELIKAFGIWEEEGELSVPIVENHADLDRLGRAVGEAIRRDTRAVLIRNHGVTVWGRTAFEAKKHLEALEFLCSWRVKLHLLGIAGNRASVRGNRVGTA
ncbi:methylthioribulose 1-phosphate dehydratase [Staphylospora marina]|uniref:methylthioribulose 1-phosphate dehydratase n=1 Tax=Staphylospora marina TaxID=2490858 RepID=UPI000F5BC9E8|nr:methylthioribulose 1-phosphate dehydratase [Staphylospora marina]